MATPEYRAAAQKLCASAEPYFDDIRLLTPKDIPLEFIRAHAEHFEITRGFGLWIWKPFIILRELEAMNEDDVLMYCDSQCLFASDPSPLFKLTHNGIGLFHQRREGHKNSKWTRGDCFRLMGCDEPKYWNGDNLNSAFSVWKKTDKSIAFVREWLLWCSVYSVVSDDPSENAPDFKAHRHDQSVLSLLAIKHEIPTLRDCSQWGDGYKQDGCDYPRIINHERKLIAPWLRRPRMSSIIEVSAIANCPMRCDYCAQDKLQEAYKGPKEITLELFEKCLDNLIPGDAVYFAGFVESCIHPQFMELLRMTLARGHRCRIYTTGRGLNVQQAREIAHMDLEKIVLHLPDAGGHLRANPLTVPVLDILATHRNASCMTMDNEPHDEVAHLWARLERGYGAMQNRAGNTELVQLQTHSHKGPIKCGVAPTLDHPVLLPSGEISLCCMDYSLKHIVGNLAETPLVDILRGPAIQKIQQLQQNGGDVLCRQCSCAVPA